MNFLAVIILYLVLPPKPPNFPELPSNYIEWYEYTSYSGVENFPHFHEYDCELQTVLDTFQPPYKVNLPGLDHFYGRVDSLFGQLHYSAVSGYCSQFAEGKGMVFIRWYPHEEVGVINMLPFYKDGTGYFNYIAHEKTGMKKINVGGRKTLRLRGCWWETQCDDLYQAVGSFTTYFIPTKTFDFRITCLTQFYERDPHYWPEGVGYDDAVPEDWTYEKTYPNRITELEQAVEGTFRVKE